MINDSLKDCNIVTPNTNNDVFEFVNDLIKNSPHSFDIYLDRKDLIVLFSGRIFEESKLLQSVMSGSRIRIITNITKNDILDCKILLSMGIEIKHIPELEGENMILNDKFFLSFIIQRRNSADKGISDIHKVMDPHLLRLQQILFNRSLA